MNDDGDNNVVTLVPRAGRFPMVLESMPGRSCSHRYKKLDKNARTLFCADCNAIMDPIDELFMIANDSSWVVLMRKEKATLEREIEALKAERDKLKSSVSGLKKRRGL
jgi:hypothetical protein